MEGRQILHDSANAEKILSMTSDTLILLQNNGICVDIVVKTENPYFSECETLIGRNIFEVFPQETIDILRPEFESVIATGEISNKNYDLPSTDKMYYFKCIMYRYDDAHVLLQYRDITQRSQMKKRLQMANMRLEEVERAAKIGYWSYNFETQVISYSGYTGAVFSGDGISLEMPISKCLKYVHPEDRESFMVNVYRSNSVGTVWGYRTFNNKKIAYVRVKIITERMENGIRIIEGYTQNVSDMIERRNELEMVLSVVDNSTESIYANKLDGTLVFANQLCRRQNHISFETDVTKHKGYDILDNIHSKDIWDKFVDSLIAHNNILKYVCTQPYPEFDVIVSDCTSYIIKNGIGEDIIWSFRRDISDQLRYEEELRHAKELAEESDRLKSSFISNMSHEIRTPLNAIVGFSGIIAQTDDEQKRKEYYKIVESNSTQLLRLVNEVLELSRMESGRVEFNKNSVDLNELCSEIQASHGLCCITVELYFDKPDSNIILITDRSRLIQIFSNLIINAIKFTPEGEIHFGYILKENEVEFYVRDTGIGIAEDQLEKVFDRFVKLNDFAPGSGLGLAICRATIEKLGGSIFVESVFNEGTTFHFTLPIQES